MYFQPLSFQQASPYVTGMQAGTSIATQNMAQQLAAQQAQQMAIQNRYLPQQLQSQLGLQGAQTQNVQAQTASVPYQNKLTQAQTGLVGTEAAKNQFLVNNPGFMVPGMAGQLAGLAWLEKNDPSLFSSMMGSSGGAGGMPNNAASAGTAGGAYSPDMITQALMSQSPQNGAPSTASLLAGGQQQGLPGGIPYSPQAIMQALGQQPQNMPGGGMSADGSQQMPMGMSGQQQGAFNPLLTPANPNSVAGKYMNMMMLPYQKDMAQMQWYNSRSSPVNNLPPDFKNLEFAQAQAFGYTPDQTSELLMKGYSLGDLAQAKGFGADPNQWPEPQGAATGAQRTWLQRRDASAGELQSLDKNINSSLAPYSRRIAGFSPTQIAQSISNDNPDQQAKFYAAKFLSMDYASLRTKILGGQVGVELVKDMQNQSEMYFKTFGAQMSPEVFQKANEYTNQWLTDALKISNKIGMPPAGANAPQYTVQGLGNQSSNPGMGAQSSNPIATVAGKNYVKINGAWYPQ
jgi:hypothetical protein